MTQVFTSNLLVVHPQDLEFGRRQVDQFVCDRPDTADVIRLNPEFRRHLEVHFAGAVHGARIYWDEREPWSKRKAEHYRSWGEFPASVRVSGSPSVTATDKCATLMFELFNLQNERRFRSLERKAYLKRLERDEYATKCVQLEYDALTTTHQYFCQYPLANVDFKSNTWYCHVFLLAGDFSDYVRYLDELGSEEYDPREYWGRNFDEFPGNFDPLR